MFPTYIIYIAALFFVIKYRKIKKSNNIQTFKEILAYTEGRYLDETTQKIEKAKRPYEKLLAAIIAAAIIAASLILEAYLLF